MGKIIQFPAEMEGRRVAFFTESKMYIGTLKEQTDFVGFLSVHLEDVVVAPIESCPQNGSAVALPGAFIMWDKVVAFAPADQFQIKYVPPAD